MSDFTHYDPNAKRKDVAKEILYHLQTAKRIADVQDCISTEEYRKIKSLYESIEFSFTMIEQTGKKCVCNPYILENYGCKCGSIIYK